MGTWGPGNLDSDGALDAVYTRSAELIKTLWERVQKQESWEADEWDYDALFVGTHGRVGAMRLFLGSVAEGLVRTAHCPVVILRVSPGSG